MTLKQLLEIRKHSPRQTFDQIANQREMISSLESNKSLRYTQIFRVFQRKIYNSKLYFYLWRKDQQNICPSTKNKC